MSEVQRAMRDDEPLMVAWKAYKTTPSFANTREWASNVEWIKAAPSNCEGQLWAAFMAGWAAAGGQIDPR